MILILFSHNLIPTHSIGISQNYRINDNIYHVFDLFYFQHISCTFELSEVNSTYSKQFYKWATDKTAEDLLFTHQLYYEYLLISFIYSTVYD